MELKASVLYDRHSTLTGVVRGRLLELPDVTVGRRFGGEAFFFRKRFFCHFHPSNNAIFLETFVWNKVGEVVRGIPGVMPHPEYGGYGWVRLPLSSIEDVAKGEKLVETTYKYLRTIKRISIRKDRFVPSSIESVKSKLPQVNFRVKETNKTMQIIMETPNAADFESADNILDRAAKMLKGDLTSKFSLNHQEREDYPALARLSASLGSMSTKTFLKQSKDMLRA